MVKMIVFTVLIFIQITGSRALTDVFVQTGDDFTLQLNKDKLPERFLVLAWKLRKDFLVSFTLTSTNVLHPYKGRVEIVENFSVKLKNLQKTDSGIYEARVTETTGDTTLAEYNITVEDPASPVVLTVDSVSKSSDSCNMTVSCRTRDSDISSTLTCDTQTCSQEGGQRSKVTASGASLRVSVVNNALICNHSNLVSWTKYQETTKTLDLCISSAAYKQRVLAYKQRVLAYKQRLLAFTITGVIASVVVLVAVVFYLLKKRERRRRLKSSRETTNANQDIAPAAERQNLIQISDLSLSVLMESPTGPEEPTETSSPPQTETVNVSARNPVSLWRAAGIRRKLIILALILVLGTTIVVGALYIADRLLLSHCDSTISVYTYPLGYAVTSQGVGHSEAIALSGFLDRCRQQNEFTVPAHVKFHKAIRCLKGSKQYKRASSATSSRKDSGGSRDSKYGHAGVSGSYLGITASAEVTFSKTEAVERSVERSVALSERVSVSSSSYQCQVGKAMVSSYEPSSALRRAVEELNADPEGQIEGFLATWGYGFVSEVEVGGYYSSFDVFSTCNKEAEESLDEAAERCREMGAKFKVSGYGMGASAGGGVAQCDTKGLSESKKRALASVSKQSQHVQIGGKDLGGAVDWESTLKMNPYPLSIRITPIFNVRGVSRRAAKLLKLSAEKVQLYLDKFMAERVPNIMTKRC